MPLVSIDLDRDTHGTRAAEIAEGVHRALVESIGIPPDDRFQVVTQRSADSLVFDRQYLAAREDVVYVRITLVGGRSDQAKRALYRQISDNLFGCGVRREDVFVVLTENDPADWSVGNGEAQLLDRPTAPTATV